MSYEPRGWREPEQLGKRIVGRVAKGVLLIWLAWAVIAIALSLESLRHLSILIDRAFGR